MHYCAFARRTEIFPPAGWRSQTTQTSKEELSAPDPRRFYSLNPPRMGPHGWTRPHEVNAIGSTDLCRPRVLMMMYCVYGLSSGVAVFRIVGTEEWRPCEARRAEAGVGFLRKGQLVLLTPAKGAGERCKLRRCWLWCSEPRRTRL